MKVVSERISFVADPASGELVLFLGGYRITLLGEEAMLLENTIARGLKELYPDTTDGREPEVATLLRSDVGWRDKVTLDAPAGDRDASASRRPAALARTRLGR